MDLEWPQLEIIDLLPFLKVKRGRRRKMFPVDMSPPHIIWFQQQEAMDPHHARTTLHGCLKLLINGVDDHCKQIRANELQTTISTVLLTVP